MKRIIAAVTAFGLIVALAALTFFLGYWRFNYPSAEKYQIRGIDVSHHQGEIDWDRIAREGYRFVYIKATEGGDFKDPRFQRNWAEAKRVGLIRGAYHFFTFCKPGVEQASNFTSVVPEDSEALPPVIDFEFVGNCRERPPRKAVLVELFAYAKLVREKCGKDPILYVTRAAHSQYLEGEIDDYRIWIRDIFRQPGRIDGKQWVIWQYADNVRINGVPRPGDQNVFYGGEQDFLLLRTLSANHAVRPQNNHP